MITNKKLPRFFPNFALGSPEANALSTEVFLESLGHQLSKLQIVTPQTPEVLSKIQHLKKLIGKVHYKADKQWKELS